VEETVKVNKRKGTLNKAGSETSCSRRVSLFYWTHISTFNGITVEPLCPELAKVGCSLNVEI
jgi:hypothetical protein